MSVRLLITIPDFPGHTVSIRAETLDPDPNTDERGYALTAQAAGQLLDAWAASDRARGYTCEETGDHDWSWILAHPDPGAGTGLVFDFWCAADGTLEVERDRWMLSDFPVAIEIDEVPTAHHDRGD